MFTIKSNEMKRLDTYMIETIGIPSMVLMETAANAVVDEILIRFPVMTYDGKTIVILCGVGNNGGDGLAVARLLIHLGYDVDIFIFGAIEKLSKDAKEQLSILEKTLEVKKLGGCQWISKDEKLNEGHPLKKSVKKSLLIVDAILGTGCNRTLSNVMVECVSFVNQVKTYVISVDVPTGINSDNGKIMGEAIIADLTITFCLPKLGLLLYPGAANVGELMIKDIHIIEEALMEIHNPIEVIYKDTLVKGLQQGVLKRQQSSHKKSFGTVGVIAGDKSMLGASLLVARAAYKSGAGLVKVFVNEEFGPLFIQALPECVLVPYDMNLGKEELDEKLEEFANSVSVLTIGPGLSNSVHARHLVERLLRLDCKVVLDADALNIISNHLEWLDERLAKVIITPHIGEMSRLTGYCSSGILENTLQFAEAFSSKYQLITVLKSARSVIVDEKGNRFINISGNSGLATAGSGDVLVGVIAGCIAQGLSLAESARYGVLLHSVAGDYYASHNAQHSLIASDIIESLWKGL